MNTHKTYLLIGLLALAFSACGTSRAEVAGWSEVAEQLVDSRNVDAAAERFEAVNHAEYSGATWFNLCHRKDCDAAALRYTQLFRDAALLSEAVRQVERLLWNTPTLESRLVLEGCVASVNDLERRAAELLREAASLIPGADFTGRDLRDAELGLSLAVEQLEFVSERAPAAAKNVALVLDAAPQSSLASLAEANAATTGTWPRLQNIAPH